MEKIVVLKGSNMDDNLVNCLRVLFPECVVEVHERRPLKRNNSIVVLDNDADDIRDERHEECLSFF